MKLPVTVPRRPRRLMLGLGGLLALAALIPRSEAQSPLPAAKWREKVWHDASALLVDDAIAALPSGRAGKDAQDRREVDLSRGVLLLNSQPKVQSNIDQARDLLESVRQQRADDDLGVSATYYLARIAEFHSETRDPDRAAALYQELIDRTPTHPLAQEAVSRLAVLRLFFNLPPEERAARMAQFEALAERLQSAPARRDLHFVLAEADLQFTADKEGVLRHLLAAESAGIVRQQLAGDTMVRIAVLARELGQRDVAVAHYEKFLAEYQHDSRAYMLAEQLKALQAQPTPAPETAAPLPATPAPAEPAATPAYSP